MIVVFPEYSPPGQSVVGPPHRMVPQWFGVMYTANSNIFETIFNNESLVTKANIKDSICRFFKSFLQIFTKNSVKFANSVCCGGGVELLSIKLFIFDAKSLLLQSGQILLVQILKTKSNEKYKSTEKSLTLVRFHVEKTSDQIVIMCLKKPLLN